ncbi:MAG TPA: radical SAM family heme chaperone HemW [Polyangiales bacterium]|jgi:oxygen-independent coproporphyrinogen-3 oxidase|nr:radical SAM family heme chaperone HemW [Polyangiales bacterium]
MSVSAYVHFPWCLQKCPYCDFASATIRRSEVPHSAYADAIVRELEWRAPGVAGQKLESVFFGGGTPSLWDPRELGRVLRAIRACFANGAASNDDGAIEITVECNPSSLDQAKAAALREAGVNRLSIGVQSLHNERLKFLGRLHDDAGALAAVRAATQEMPRVSADLMFGNPGQTAEDFWSELSRVLELGLSHVSVYALTIEPQTQFGELHRKGKLTLAKEDDYARTFVDVHERLGALGFSHYEVSNYAKPGESSRHNQHYWRGGDYLGLGCAAVGCVGARRYRNDPQPAKYLERSATREVEAFEETLDAQALVREALMLGLRTHEGVQLKELAARTKVDPLAGRERELTRAQALGNVVIENDVLRVPHARWLHLDSIVADLF